MKEVVEQLSSMKQELGDGLDRRRALYYYEWDDEPTMSLWIDYLAAEKSARAEALKLREEP